MIAALFSKTSSLGIKVRGLEAFAILCGGPGEDKAVAGDGLDGMLGMDRSRAKSTGSAVLDKYTIQEKVVPLLKAIKTKEPAVMMAALSVFKQVGKIADSDFLAMDVLPILWSFSLGPLLNLRQFKEFMDLIKSLSSRIEQEQSRKLQELSSSTANASGSSSHDLSSFGVLDASGQPDRLRNSGEDDFERLVLGKRGEASGDSKLDAVRGSSACTGPHNQSIGAQSSIGPAFSWSTAPSGALSTQLAVSRAITPDQNLSSFAALTPSTASSSSFTRPVSSVDGWAAQRASPNPSLATLSSMTSAMVNMSAGSSFQSSDELSAVSTAPPPTQLNNASTQSSTFAPFSIAPPPAKTGTSVGQPRYGAGLGSPTVAAGSLTQLKSPQRQGLDAYESLL